MSGTLTVAINEVDLVTRESTVEVRADSAIFDHGNDKLHFFLRGEKQRKFKLSYVSGWYIYKTEDFLTTLGTPHPTNRKENDMSHFSKRFKRLLDFADHPVPGDHVRIGRKSAAQGGKFVDRIGVVKQVWAYNVEVDGEVVKGMSPNSLEIVHDDEIP